jgi:hypothetical protein
LISLSFSAPFSEWVTSAEIYWSTLAKRPRHQGAWFPRQGELREPDGFLGLWECYADPTNRSPFALPKSRLLRVEIEELETKAASIEAELGPLPGAEAEQVRPPAVAAPQPELQGASRWKDAPRRAKDDSGFVPWPGGPAAGL